LFFSRSSSNWRAKRQDFQVTTSPKVGKLQGVKRCKKLSRFQLACRLPLESLKIFPFSNLTRNFFRGEKEEMVDGCNLLKPLAGQQQWQHCARATCNASEQPLFFKNTLVAIVHIFHQNSIKSDDKIVKKMGQPTPRLKYRLRKAFGGKARRRVASG